MSKSSLIKAAYARYGRILRVKKRWRDCFTETDTELFFWFNTPDNSTHIVREKKPLKPGGPMETKTKNVQFRITPSLHKKLSIRAKKARRKLCDYCRVVLEKHVDVDYV